MLNIPAIASPPSFNLNTKILFKWMATALAASLIATSLLIVAYGSWILNSAPHHLPFFQGLEQLNSGQIALIILGSSITALFSSGLLIYIHHRKDREHHLDKNLRPLVSRFEGIDVYQFPAQNFNFVKSFLEELSHAKISPQKHHCFYYHLSCLSEHILKNDSQNKKPWVDFLEMIHNRNGRLDNNQLFAINTKWELKRLNRAFPPFITEELESDAAKKEALPYLTALRQEAFEIPPSSWWTTIFSMEKTTGFEAILFARQNRTFIIRNQEDREILAMIMLEKQPLENEKPNLYIHTLARKACAVKIGLTEQFHAALQIILQPEAYTEIYCQVLKNNLHAKRIYERLGFVEAFVYPEYYTMIYPQTI